MKYRDPETGEFKELTVKVSDTMPVGTIIAYGSDNIPDDWMECKGDAISRTLYAELFSKIGTTFGTGDGSTTFNLPDLRGRTIYGQFDIPKYDPTFSEIGYLGGEEKHTLTVDEMPSHTHDTTTLNVSSAGQSVANDNNAIATIPYDITISTSDAKGWNNALAQKKKGGGEAHNNLPPYMVAVYIIKVSASSIGNVAQVISTQSDSEINTYSCNYINNQLSSIVESGSNDNGSYIKWSDGTMICCKIIQGNANVSAWGNLYYVDIDCGSWAKDFISFFNTQVTNNDTQYWCTISNSSANKCGTVRLVRPNANGQKYEIHLLGIGKWK